MHDLASELLDGILARPEAEWERALAAAAAAHPELAATLQKRFATLRTLGLLPDEHAAPPGLAVPERLGEFTLLEKLGGGGMGVVYLARQESVGREVALKLIRPELALFENSKERFTREAEAIARLSHPGVVPIYTFGTAQGIPYYAMERVDGRSLGDALDAVDGRDPATLTGADLMPGTGEASWVAVACRVVLRIAEALAHAHARGVVHRDVKPSNVMLARDGRVMVLDFGLALSSGHSRITHTMAQLGSLPYSSPEQVHSRAREVDARSDVFSLGAVLYECVTLRLPFDADTPQEVMRKILSADPVPADRRNRAAGADLVAILAKALEKAPERRYQTMDELAADLRALLEYRPVCARRQTRLVRALRWARREPFRAGLAALAVVLGAAAIYLAATAGDRARGAEARLRAAVEEHLERGFLLSDPDGSDRLARAELEAALALQPDCQEARAKLGLATAGPGAASRPGEGETPLALFVRAVALLNGSRRDDAAAKHRACALLDTAILHSSSARPLYFFQLAEAAASAKDRSGVERAVDGMLYLWPRSARAWCSAGRSLAGIDPRRAESCLRKALELEPSLRGAWTYLGVALHAQGRTGEAAQALAKAVAADPDDPKAWIDLGFMQLAEERASDAAASLRRAVALAPSMPGTHYNLGCALFKLGETDAALREFERTVELAPDYREAWTNIGEMHKAAGRDEARVATLRAATEHNPQWADAFAWLGSALLELGRRDEALPAVRRYVELNPNDTAMRDWLARNDKRGK